MKWTSPCSITWWHLITFFSASPRLDMFNGGEKLIIIITCYMWLHVPNCTGCSSCSHVLQESMLCYWCVFTAWVYQSNCVSAWSHVFLLYHFVGLFIKISVYLITIHFAFKVWLFEIKSHPICTYLDIFPVAKDIYIQIINQDIHILSHFQQYDAAMEEMNRNRADCFKPENESAREKLDDLKQRVWNSHLKTQVCTSHINCICEKKECTVWPSNTFLKRLKSKTTMKSWETVFASHWKFSFVRKPGGYTSCLHTTPVTSLISFRKQKSVVFLCSRMW